MTVLLFDGVCNLCSQAVQFVIDHDVKGVIKFAALQSEQGQMLLRKHGLPTETMNSLVLIEGEQGRENAYTESTGALRLARYFGGVWQLLYVFIALPKPVRDVVYRWIGKNRYRWFGQQDACMVPSATLRARFL